MGTSSIMNILDWDEKPKPQAKKEMYVHDDILSIVCTQTQAFEPIDRFNVGLGAHVISSLLDKALSNPNSIRGIAISEGARNRASLLREYFGLMLAQKKLAGETISSPWEMKLSTILGNPHRLREVDIGVLATLPRIWQKYRYLEEMSEISKSFPIDIHPTNSSYENCTPLDNEKSIVLETKNQVGLLLGTEDNMLLHAEINVNFMNFSMRSMIDMVKTSPLPLTVTGQYHTRELPGGFRYLVCRNAGFGWSKK